MKKTTFSILFFVKRTLVKKNGELPIYARITINGERVQFVIQMTVKEELWDNTIGKAKGFSDTAKMINNYLEIVMTKLRDVKVYLEEHNEILTATKLRDKYMGMDVKSRTILEIFNEHNEKCKALVDIDFAPETVIRYITTCKHVAEFIQHQYKRSDLKLSEINPTFIRDFEFYLKTIKKVGHNSTVKYIKNFKKIIRIALANGWMMADPFANIKYRLEDVDMAYLTDEELKKIMDTDFEMERIQVAKDIYVFCCFTGLAYVDIQSLSYDDIESKDGQLWIKKKRQKTKNWFYVPMLPPAVRLMEKYKNHPYCIKTNRVFPVSSNQKINFYLKEIADACDIKKNLSTHTARHTFATTVALSNQVSMEVVAKMLGHSSVNMTKKYARVLDELINKDMKKVYDKYKSISL